MRKSLVYIASLSVAAMAAPLTLQEALEMAKSNNSQIKAEKAKVEMAESGQSEAFSRFLPKVSLSAGVTKINDPITIDLSRLQGPLSEVAGAAAYSKAYLSAYNMAYTQAYNDAVKQAMSAGLDEATAKSMVDQRVDEIRSGVMGSNKVNTLAQQAAENYGADASNKINDTDFGMKVQDDVFFNARVTVVWPIFTGLKIYSAYDAAKENVAARKAEFDMAQNTILMDVATKYFTLRLTEELSVMRESTMKNLEGHLERSKKLEEGGQISKAERLRAGLDQLLLVVGKAAARTAERICRAHNNGIAYGLRKMNGGVNIRYYITFNYRLVRALHKPLKAVTVLALFYRLY